MLTHRNDPAPGDSTYDPANSADCGDLRRQSIIAFGDPDQLIEFA